MNGEAAAGRSDTGPIKVGIYGDLSGRTASFGQSSANGAKMAADEISKAGGILGRQIEIFNEDDQGRPEQAATVVTKLINQDKVHASDRRGRLGQYSGCRADRAAGRRAYDLTVLNQSGGHSSGRLHFPGMLYRSVSRRGHGQVRRQYAERQRPLRF